MPEVDALLRSTADKTGALIVVGVIHPTGDAKWNEARLYFPDRSIRTYEKHHMLPVYEGELTVGTARTEWQDSTGLWGITICKDMDFPKLSREYGTMALPCYSSRRGTSTWTAGGTDAWRYFAESRADSALRAHPSKEFSRLVTIADGSLPRALLVVHHLPL